MPKHNNWTFEIYKAADGWRWRLLAHNKKIIADSGEAYTRKASCKRAIGSVINGAVYNYEIVILK